MKTEFYADIDQETKDFLNEILYQTNAWRVKAETMQKHSKVNGIKGYLLGKVIDSIGELFDLCAKNQGE